ncbi:hypothetical protein ACJX0J_013459, partial [Zea mays]
QRGFQALTFSSLFSPILLKDAYALERLIFAMIQFLVLELKIMLPFALDIAMIKEQNDHIAKLSAKIAKHELENENFKFAHNMLYNGRRPGIKDGIGFQSGSQSNIKLNAPRNKLSNF